MSNQGRDYYDDEIDLFEVVEILWQGKWIIVATVFIALVAAYTYLMNREVVYKYSVPYSFITAPDVEALIGIKLVLKENINHALTFSDAPFSLNTKNKTLSLTSANPNYETAVSDEAALIGKKITQSLIDEANITFQLIEENAPAQILNSEVAASRYFKAKSVLQRITHDGTAMVFRSVVKTVKSATAPLVLALSVVMGGMMGLFFIFLLRAYKKRQ